MATKTVTLKDSNGDTLYPVTDSNVVNINQQKTLAQALDGVVYAEDPTQNATPTAWVTGSDIDWTTIVTNLYEAQNVVGTNATFQLSESAANFRRLRFFFKSNDGDYSSLDVYEPDGKTISTVVVHPIPNASYSKITLWSISGTTVTKGVSIQVANDGAVQSADYIYITRVEGWKI